MQLIRLFIFILCFALPLTVHAKDLYYITGVKVDRYAQNATEARKKAINNGKELAFYQVVKKITATEMHHYLPELVSNDIEPMIDSYNLEDEKISPDRYRAVLSVQFKPDYIKSWLENNKIPYFENIRPKSLLIPIFTSGVSNKLWDHDNIWYESWREVVASKNIDNLILPVGDLEDIAALNADMALIGEYKDFELLNKKYGTKEVIIVHAVNNTEQIDIAVKMIGSQSVLRKAAKFPLINAQDKQSATKEIIQDMVFRLDNYWKQRGKQRQQSKWKFTVKIPVSSLQDWLNIESRIKQLKFLHDVKVVSLSSGAVKVKMSYYGDMEQLLLDFNDERFYLMEENNQIILRFAS